MIETLTDRLKYKEKSLTNRKVLALKMFFMRNIKNYVGHYIHRWKNKINHEKKVARFADILERKTRVIIKNRFFLNLHKQHYEKELH